MKCVVKIYKEDRDAIRHAVGQLVNVHPALELCCDDGAVRMFVVSLVVTLYTHTTQSTYDTPTYTDNIIRRHNVERTGSRAPRDRPQRHGEVLRELHPRLASNASDHPSLQNAFRQFKVPNIMTARSQFMSHDLRPHVLVEPHDLLRTVADLTDNTITHSNHNTLTRR